MYECRNRHTVKDNTEIVYLIVIKNISVVPETIDCKGFNNCDNQRKDPDRSKNKKYQIGACYISYLPFCFPFFLHY